MTTKSLTQAQRKALQLMAEGKRLARDIFDREPPNIEGYTVSSQTFWTLWVTFAYIRFDESSQQRPIDYYIITPEGCNALVGAEEET